MPIPDVLATFKIWYVPEGGAADDAIDVPSTGHRSEVVRGQMLDVARKYLEEQNEGAGYIVVFNRETGQLVAVENFRGAALIS